LARGARKVYAGARDPAAIKQRGIEAIRLDVTKPEEIMAAAAHAGDVALLINNAAIAHQGGFLARDSEEVARRQLETNFFGMLRVTKAFAPILAANGGGALLNVLSVASWINSGGLAAYAASKSAAWSLTNSLRYELASQKTQVLALHMGFVDTDLARGIDAPKASADEIVKHALDALESGLEEVLADERARRIKQGLAASRSSYLPQTAPEASMAQLARRPS
jgi:short-subunit dehydrogenase